MSKWLHLSGPVGSSFNMTEWTLMSQTVRSLLKHCDSFHWSTTSWVDVNNTPSPLYTVLTVHCVPFLRRWMVSQNLFEAVLESFTMASPNVSFLCLGDHHSRTLFGLLVPVCCLRSLTSQKGPLGLLLQLNGIPHRWCSPAGSGVAPHFPWSLNQTSKCAHKHFCPHESFYRSTTCLSDSRLFFFRQMSCV